MHPAPSSRLTARGSTWLVIGGLWIAAVVLSTLQIYFREATRGLQVPWGEVLAANALAWLPWLAIAPAVIALERRFPVPGKRTVRHLALHVGSAIVASVAFLVYLGYFHAAYLEGGGLLPPGALLRSELAEKLGQHFLVALALYVMIALGSSAHRSWTSRVAGRDGASEEHTASPSPLMVRSVGEVERIEPADVDWIEGCGNYARLHLGERRVLIRRTLSSLGEELEAAGFLRVHRSAIVNAHRISKLRSGSHGDAEVELDGGQRVKVSRTFRQRLESAL